MLSNSLLEDLIQAPILRLFKVHTKRYLLSSQPVCMVRNFHFRGPLQMISNDLWDYYDVVSCIVLKLSPVIRLCETVIQTVARTFDPLGLTLWRQMCWLVSQ